MSAIEEAEEQLVVRDAETALMWLEKAIDGLAGDLGRAQENFRHIEKILLSILTI